VRYGIYPQDLRRYVVVPVLYQLDLLSDAAVSLLLGTAMHESNLTYLHQLNGPALGLWQMEPFTHDDCWKNFLFFRRDLAARVRSIVGVAQPTAEDMVTNNTYACAMARVRYRRVPGDLPPNSPLELATYWKQHYNTPLGKGTIEQALPHFVTACSLT
jgi:hypothetical protein